MNLTYLMTSNFDENMTPLEMKDLLLLFRKEYRKLDSSVIQLQRISIENEDKIKEMKQIINSQQKQLSIVKKNYNKTLNRKLSLKERISGKIINNT